MSEVGETPESELERILNEKLYIRKNNPLKDKSNTTGNMKKPSFVYQENSTTKDVTITNKETNLPIFPGKSEDKYVFENMENDIDLQDVFRTKAELLNSMEHPFNTDKNLNGLGAENTTKNTTEGTIYSDHNYENLLHDYPRELLASHSQDSIENCTKVDPINVFKDDTLTNTKSNSIPVNNSVSRIMDKICTNNEVDRAFSSDTDTNTNKIDTEYTDNKSSVENETHKSQILNDFVSKEPRLSHNLNRVDSVTDTLASTIKRAKTEVRTGIDKHVHKVSFLENPSVVLLDRSKSKEEVGQNYQREDKNQCLDVILQESAERQRQNASSDRSYKVQKQSTFTGETKLEKELESKKLNDHGCLYPEDGECSKFDKIKKLEKEFNILIKTNRDTLQLKSKLHKFIYNEIEALNREYVDRVSSLVKENKELKTEISQLKEEIKSNEVSYEKFKEYVKSNVVIWKGQVENYVKEYLKKIKTRQFSLSKDS